MLSVLEGQVPGMFITQATGVPGGSFTVQIRGQNSLLNGNQPLYVVDGVPYPSNPPEVINPTLGGQDGMSLNYLDPGNIESIEILKDADATSIYGSRAANGAVIITTKKGNPGRMKVNLNLQQGVNSLTVYRSC